MKTPESLETLVDYGIIQEVVRPLMSGKEAQVFVVVAGGEECVAKVYKEANQRTFKHRSDYTEGRRTRNTRDQRAMSKRTQHGRRKDEDAWRSTEVEMIYRLRDAGVRVPEPINFVEGVLVMELVKDADGHAAPRLGDLTFSPSEAHEIYQKLMREVVRMLCAGVVHGDLSDFNVLMSHDGPVVIDFPQSVDPTNNPNSQKLLLRDVENLHRFLARFAPDQPLRPYGQEIWSLYRKNRLTPDTKLSGDYVAPAGKADTREVMALIDDANRDERMRRDGRESDADKDFEGSGKVVVKSPAQFRTVVDFGRENASRTSARKRDGVSRGARPAGRRRRPTSEERVPPTGPAADSAATGDVSPTSRRHRRGGRSGQEPARDASERAPRSGATTAEVGKPGSSQRRRRRRRSRARAQADVEAKSGAGKAGTDAAAKAGAQGKATRPANPGRPSGGARSSSEVTEAGTGNDRPARRRRGRGRRRPRNASSPE
jgi:RIO kinase 1